MKKVVLFKSESEDYKDAFSEKEMRAVFVEPLQFSAVNGAELGARLERAYDGLVLTSARAVDACSARWDPAKRLAWSARRVYTVGPATARAIKRSLGLDALGETSGNAENLAKTIVEENPAGSRFLFPCGNVRSEALPLALEAAAVAVDALTVYETGENATLGRALAELAASAPDALVFFSPAGCEYVHRRLQTVGGELARLPHFAIGHSTAHKIETLGLDIAGVAAAPRPDALARAVLRYFAAGK